MYFQKKQRCSCWSARSIEVASCSPRSARTSARDRCTGSSASSLTKACHGTSRSASSRAETCTFSIKIWRRTFSPSAVTTGACHANWPCGSNVSIRMNPIEDAKAKQLLAFVLFSYTHQVDRVLNRFWRGLLDASDDIRFGKLDYRIPPDFPFVRLDRRLTAYGAEREVLLPRNTSFQIANIVRNERCVLTCDARIEHSRLMQPWKDESGSFTANSFDNWLSQASRQRLSAMTIARNKNRLNA